MKVISRDAMAAAFAEWDRRYREDPEGFDEEWHASSTAVEYGQRAADYFLAVLRSAGGVATMAPDSTVQLHMEPEPERSP
jgi:hypothetical protein